MWSKAGFLKLSWASSRLEGLLKQIGPAWSGVAPAICISNKFPCGADGASLGPHFENYCSKITVAPYLIPGHFMNIPTCTTMLVVVFGYLGLVTVIFKTHNSSVAPLQNLSPGNLSPNYSELALLRGSAPA